MWKRGGLFSISLVLLLIIYGMTAIISLPDDIFPFNLTKDVSASFAGDGGETSNVLMNPMDDPENVHQNMERIASDIMSNYFIENKGQIAEKNHLFYSTSRDVHFLPDGVLMRFRELEPIYNEGESLFLDSIEDKVPEAYHDRGVILKYSFVGANDVIPVGRERCSWDTNYFKGSDPDRWYTDVPNYMEIVYPEVWEGIDIIYRLKDRNVKYDIVISPGADPSLIKFKIEGSLDLDIDGNGTLIIGTYYWDILDSRLIAFYDDSNIEEIEIEFGLMGANIYGFKIGDYDISKKIVIDPLIFSTIIGGSNDDCGRDIEIDSSGNAYITGWTYNAFTDYPTTIGAYDTSHNDDYDVFLTKLNSNGSSLEYSTFIGGSDKEIAFGIDIDTNGNAYITGYTVDDTTDYPTTSSAYDTSHNGDKDVFVTKLNSTGSSLIYSTLIGGSDEDRGYGIDIDANGNAYIIGYTNDAFTDYPTTSGAYDTSHNGNYDVFVTKLNSTGSSLIYSTFIGGSGEDFGRDIEIDSSGNGYLTGYTASTGYPTTNGAYDTSHNGKNDVFVTKLNSAGSSLSYSTFIGGSDGDEGHDIKIDSSGNSYITGNTLYNVHITTHFPTTTGSYDTTHNGAHDVFVTKLNSAGSSLIYSTFIGGSGNDFGFGIDIDSSGNTYISGYTENNAVDYPTIGGAYDTSHNGKYDVFVTKLNSAGSSLIYSTFLGGSNMDYGFGIDIDASGNAYFSGMSVSGFPTTIGAYDTTHNGDYDGFATKLQMTLESTPPTFGTDLTPIFGTTGDQFDFGIYVADNKEVSTVSVEHWYESGLHTNSSMSGSDPYTFTITLVSDVQILNYIFHANDPAGNWNQTSQNIVTIIDNDAPVFGIDGSDNLGLTDDTFSYSIEVNDNIVVEDVYVEYWYGTESHINTTMSGIGPYSWTILIPSDSTDPLHYIFHACDGVGNWNETLQKDVTILDNDRPIFVRDLCPAEGSTGVEFEFRAVVEDNIEVASVWVEYWFGNGEYLNEAMEGKGNYSYTITIPSDSLLDLNYFFYSYDSSENMEYTTQRTVQIYDNDAPMSSHAGDSIVTDVETVLFNASLSTDNIGITNYTWMFEYSGELVKLFGVTSAFQFQMIGVYMVELNVTDGAGLWNVSYMNITVLDGTPPVITLITEDLIVEQLDGFFALVLNVTDQTGVEDVKVSFTDYLGAGLNISMMTNGNGTWGISIPIQGPPRTIDLNIWAVDLLGNWISMGPVYLVILVSELPIITLHYNESTETENTILVEAEIFNASVINGVILTYNIDGGPAVEGAMYLHEGTYRFDIPAQLEPCVISFEVELSYHLKNRNMTESGLVTVAEGEADTITLHLGPVKDSEGNRVSGALVQVWINEEMEEGSTDDEGYAYFEIDPDVIGQEIDIKISKDGYRNLEFSAVVLEDGSLSGPIPTLDKEKSDDGLSVAIIIIGILMVLLVLAILIFLILKKKGSKGSNEEQIEEPIGEPPLEVSDNPPSIQEEHVKEILEAQQEHPLDNSQERPILESPQEQPQLPEEDIQNQQVPETDLVSLEEPPVEEVISDEAPLASSEQMPMGDNLSTESGPSQTI